CGARAAARLPRTRAVRVVSLTNAEARRFSCGLVGLKGELGARLLGRIAAEPGTLDRLRDPATDLLDLVAGEAPSPPRIGRRISRPNTRVDQVITLSQAWLDKHHRTQFQYFIPEWDDLVDPEYDFETDTHSGGTGDWSNEVFAHQIYSEP